MLPYIQSDIKYFTIASGNQSFLEENMFNNKIPSRVIFAMVSNASFIGNFVKNPFFSIV